MANKRFSPIDYTFPDGTKTQMHYICDLAEGIGRTTTTIRAWEVSGVIPKTPFKDTNTWKEPRLYTTEMLNSLIECAERSGISAGRSMTQTRFKVYIHEAWGELIQKYQIMMQGGTANAVSKETKATTKVEG